MFSEANSVTRIEPESEEHAGVHRETAGGVFTTVGADPDVSLEQLNVRDQQALVDTLTAGKCSLTAPKAIRTAGDAGRCG